MPAPPAPRPLPTRAALLVALVVATLTQVAPPAAGTAPRSRAASSGALRIRVLSNRADLISGGDALVRVVPPQGEGAEGLTVRVGGSDVTDAFAADENGRIVGLVEGLEVGRNVLTAELPDGRGARITITNHPIGGPVFSGRQVQPWACTTMDNGLGPPQGPKCNAHPVTTEVVFVGDSGPLTVTVERGTMNRGIYDLAMPPNWNHKLLWAYGASCSQTYNQGRPGTVLNNALSQGFAVASSSMTEYSQHCNDVTSSESVMMLKEHIVETYGEIIYTVGMGSSGGAMQQILNAANYPGLLQGIQPGAAFPDTWTPYQEFGDCGLLVRYWNSSTMWADPADTAAVAGTGGTNTTPCTQMQGRSVDYMHPSNGNCAGEATYHPETNRRGSRCNLQDYQVSIFGKRPEDGFATRPYDNVGVQYGLEALQAEEITPEQFVDMNQNVGGWDIDMNWQRRRSRADIEAVLTAHRSGRVVSGRHLEKVAMMFPVGTNNNDYHAPVHPYVTRARLNRDNGHHDNQVLWTSVPQSMNMFTTINAWLAAVEADHRDIPLARKLVMNKPPEAVDTCGINGEAVTDRERCREAYPHFGKVRMVAGGPLSNDVMQCRLKPLRRADYDVEFTDQQWDGLQRTFPTGVCDYSRLGVGQRVSVPWATFAGGPGGRPLGPAPRSTPFG